eukprot:scaffold96233_cov33-Tisochrysis_lutea.AAC.2
MARSDREVSRLHCDHQGGTWSRRALASCTDPPACSKAACAASRPKPIAIRSSTPALVASSKDGGGGGGPGISASPSPPIATLPIPAVTVATPDSATSAGAGSGGGGAGACSSGGSTFNSGSLIGFTMAARCNLGSVASGGTFSK